MVKSIIDEVYQMELGSERNVFRSNLLEEVLGDNFCMLWRLGCRKDPLFTSLLIKKYNSSEKFGKIQFVVYLYTRVWNNNNNNSPDAKNSYSITYRKFPSLLETFLWVFIFLLICYSSIVTK